MVRITERSGRSIEANDRYPYIVIDAPGTETSEQGHVYQRCRTLAEAQARAGKNRAVACNSHRDLDDTWVAGDWKRGDSYWLRAAPPLAGGA